RRIDEHVGRFGRPDVQLTGAHHNDVGALALPKRSGAIGETQRLGAFDRRKLNNFARLPERNRAFICPPQATPHPNPTAADWPADPRSASTAPATEHRPAALRAPR